MKRYHRRLSHEIPAWVKDGSVFHIRIRVSGSWKGSLVEPSIGSSILESVSFYQEKGNWNCRVFLLMPDHLHGLFAFNPDLSMSEVVRNWKRYHTRASGVGWQDNFFDHRLRSHQSLEEKARYIRNNPVVRNLCETLEEWPWVFEGKDWL